MEGGINVEGKIKLEGYTWKEARDAFKAASFEMERIELPTIFSCFDWKGLKCLELSRNEDARVALSYQNKSKHTDILVPRPELAVEIERNAGAAGVVYGKYGKINASLFNPKFKLEINEKYDVVYAEWISHSWLENKELVESILNVSGKYFLIVMPHPDSDDTKIACIENPLERERRIRVKDNLRKILQEMGWGVNYIEQNLPLRFKSADDARKTFYCSIFGNQATPNQKKEIDLFLTEDKSRNFDDKFYIIWAEKIK